ncbi:MAG TPA: ATP-binding cassette domain-containing protein [Gammaproteobacteria bacterium]|nr:ATP-binding cassette domain-containing protein [Gammaproteobacteria bacterium]
MPKNAALVRVENLYRYYDRRCAVQDLSFELGKGEILGLLGPNGAGKTSTLQMLSGNLAPSAGRIFIDGVDILDEPLKAKAALGYLPEVPPLYPELTVDEYLAYCAELHRVPKKRIRAACASAKERCGLKDTGGRLIGNLSKGYQQRVGIAQAIVHAPKVVILDEPTVGLDPIQIREIRALIGELGREHGVMLSTHILPEVQAVCSRVQIIHKGRLVFSDTLADLNERMQVTSLLLECREPPTMKDLKAVAGVEAVEKLGAGRFRLRYTAGSDPVEEIATLAVRGKWGLRALTPEYKSLEQVFVELTASDEGSLETAA